MLSVLQLEALVAVSDVGSFERAADELGVTPSAVSQRIAGLEKAVGQILVQRTKPVTLTPQGRTLVRLGRQMVTLQRDALDSLISPRPAQHVAVAVNADSFSSWFTPVITGAAGVTGLVLDLRRQDEVTAFELLRGGEVMAAVCTSAKPAPGCRVTRLGRLRYIPAAAPALLETYAGRLADMPVVRYDRGDLLDAGIRRAAGAHGEPPAHYIPTSRGYRAAVAAGLGWGTLSEAHFAELNATGAVVRAHPSAYTETVLYWQRWKLSSRGLDAVTTLVRAAAKEGLRAV